MTNKLIDRLTQELGYVEISLDNHDSFTRRPGLNVLFFPGNPETVKDATDVAVVLPELINAFGENLNPGVVTDTYGAGKELKQKYGFSQYPALVFVRDGEYVGAISRIQDWSEYQTKINTFLAAPTRRAPGFSIPVVAG
jgi:hydrogenase-1 operon protein HyaE